jgi:hypothetical protein
MSLRRLCIKESAITTKIVFFGFNKRVDQILDELYTLWEGLELLHCSEIFYEFFQIGL